MLPAVRNPIIVALDVPEPSQALALAKTLAPFVGAFKIGGELFTAAGPEIVETIRSFNAPVFLDLKFHDIPNTVAKSVAAAVRLGVQMLTVHASGGRRMLEAAEQAAQATARQFNLPPPLVLAVTVLTSMDASDLAEIGLNADPQGQVERLAALAALSGIRGLVCSPLEIKALRALLPAAMQLVTPGIRAEEEASSDQRRTLSAREAIQAGASWLVIGRPIYAAADPAAAARRILDSILN
jgi:orotidine-5'-phosphate decarboxylase